MSINFDNKYVETVIQIILKLSDNLNCIIFNVWQKGEPIFTTLSKNPKYEKEKQYLVYSKKIHQCIKDTKNIYDEKLINFECIM